MAGQNVGLGDSTIRFFVAAWIYCLGLVHFGIHQSASATVVAAILQLAAYPVYLTAARGHCPVYDALGLDTG